jgi:hypothetical protein
MYVFKTVHRQNNLRQQTGLILFREINPHYTTDGKGEVPEHFGNEWMGSQTLISCCHLLP